jgi:hypothetical protein
MTLGFDVLSSGPSCDRETFKHACTNSSRHVGQRTLATGFTNQKPQYFSVWEFTP